MSRLLAGIWLLAAGLCLAGCRLRVEQIHLNRPLAEAPFAEIVLGESTRGEVLALLGPPDRARYTPRELFFEYWAASHRATDLEFFVPSDVIPGPFDPLGILSVTEYFFDPFREPDEFKPTFLERRGRNLANVGLAVAPFIGGQEIVTLHGRQTRLDRWRVVFDLKTLKATHKALRLATGEYEEQSFVEEVLLQDD